MTSELDVEPSTIHENYMTDQSKVKFRPMTSIRTYINSPNSSSRSSMRKRRPTLVRTTDRYSEKFNSALLNNKTQSKFTVKKQNSQDVLPIYKLPVAEKTEEQELWEKTE